MRLKAHEVAGFLKRIEAKWKLKLERRFDRERYVSSREEALSTSKPRYILSMFPYPSGRLHLGHVRIYTSGDILARYSRLMCKNEKYSKQYSNVIYPMGFDSFGLPAENAAKERGLNPAVWTNNNIRTMKKQLEDLALNFDWREATSNPRFYKWTQELFLKLLDSGLVYKSYSKVNWDPVDKTVLADEQVDATGRSWRSGAKVEKRNYRQWFVKVNAFTNSIYNADEIDPESWRDVLAIQRNWIGKPSGWLFYLPVSKLDSSEQDILPVFTRNPEFLHVRGTKLLIHKDHWLEDIYHISQVGHISNPFNGCEMEVELTENDEDLPTGTKATLINELAKNLPPCNISREQVLLHASMNNLGGYFTSDSYRDWLISRQRFWGTPIPAVHCNKCGHQGVLKSSLPVVLPAIDKFTHKPTSNEYGNESGQTRIITPLEELAPKEWVETNCPTCGSLAKRECETLDTLFDSSWYFLRYATCPTDQQPFDPHRVQPVWCYIGGKEHASMHLFFARFMTHFLHSKGHLEFKEPFTKLLVQGVVKSRTYKMGGRFLSKSEYDALEDKTSVEVTYEKMSKSKGNGVDPQDLLDRYGVDATRFCLMSYANPRTERLWRSEQEEFEEVLSFLRRVIMTVQEYCDIGEAMSGQSKDLKLNIKELAQEELEERQARLSDVRNKSAVESIFNIQVSNQFRQFISVLHVLSSVTRQNINNTSVYTKEFAKALASLIVMLNPITPHLSEELWAMFSNTKINPLRSETESPFRISLQAADQPWPIPDEDYQLLIKVRGHESDVTVDKIPVAREKFNSLSIQDIAEVVESHYRLKNEECKVLEISKYEDLMALVVADIKSMKRASEGSSKKVRRKKKVHDI